MSFLRWRGATWSGWSYTVAAPFHHVFSVEYRRRHVNGESDRRVTVGWTRS